ncbi:MAG: hypothetical protein AMJ88_07830 [Anaerolineae bacterium SM23_ 63]|nr:MAG: hypothetical protein AMJ88_07830 [Anaerolineae bacterium SM23_ 63]
MLIGILSWIVSSLFVFTITYLWHRELRTNRASLNAMSFIFLAIFITTLFTLIMGLIGLLKPEFFLIISGLGLLGVIILPATREKLVAVGGEIREFIRQLDYGWRDLPRWLRSLIVIVIVATVVRFAFLILALPPFVWDSLTYHLTNVAEWTQHGRIFLVNASVTRVASPSNYEVFATWFTLFFHHDVVVEAAGIPAFILAFIATFALARILGLSKSSASIAVLGFGSTPALIMATTGTKNDPLMAGLFIMATTIVVNLFQLEREDCAKNLTGQILLLVLVLMYALGTKPYIIHLIPGLLLIAIMRSLQKGKGRYLIELLRKIWMQRWKLISAFRWTMIVGLAAGLLLGGLWYIRNWIVFENPFFPYSIEYGDKLIFQSPRQSGIPLSLERLPQNLISFASKFGDKQGVIIPSLKDTTGWGWFAYALGLPSLLWVFFRRPNLRTISLGFMTSLLMLFISTRDTPYNMRYAIWVPAIMALAFASFYDWIPTRYRFERYAFSMLLVVCLGLNFLLTLNYNRVLIRDFVGILKVPIWQRDTSKLHIYVDPEYEQALDVVPNDETLGYNLHHDAFIYPLYRADFSQRLVYVPFSGDNTCDNLVEVMKIHGTRWLFAIPERTLPANLALVQKCVEDSYLVSLEAGIYVLNDE